MADISRVRELTIQLHGLAKADAAYTLYYDETNNARRLHVTPDGFNVRDPACFVLGGVGHAGPPRPLDIAALHKAVRLQPTAKELKLEHLGGGDFLKLIGGQKVAAYLAWMKDQDLFVHYSAVDPVYWSTVDIVDAIISDDQMGHMTLFGGSLKDDLYTVLRIDLDHLADLYRRHGYPNIAQDAWPMFAGELLDILEAREELLDHFNYYTLKGVLQHAARGATLAYLEREAANTLIDSFVDFFAERFWLLKNATHVLDVEPFIRKRLDALDLCDGDRPITNFRFDDSKAEPGVQVSDPIVGLLGKFLTYIGRTDPEDLANDAQDLSPLQRANLSALNELLDRSAEENPAFMKNVMAATDLQRARDFLEGA
ncbi:DUF3800 domain-containing protein [Caulobacter sp. 17J65-9]|uniref:DUF3800 domain-containing protein n=1 Tax=Caulobacter sp. 17J65-9 TaxID=2709382 RepID=UPI0013CC6EDF|nr:DUF3800 domain-containing protein [Caulobacter sp. 17J65-9]NEX91190.1 DUF3800 domain-containing protein [Caulobacter sp. 17J65-9]